MLPRPGGGVVPSEERKSGGGSTSGGGGLYSGGGISMSSSRPYSGGQEQRQQQKAQPAIGNSFYTANTGANGAGNGVIGGIRVINPSAPSLQVQQQQQTYAQNPQSTYQPHHPAYQQPTQPLQPPYQQAARPEQRQAPQPQANAVDWNQWAPSGVNEQMLNMGSSMATSFLANNMARYQPGMVGMWANLKYYFAVNNSYVLNKLKVLLFPFLKKSWARVVSPSEGGGDQDRTLRYARPSVDSNAPDLYIPVMSFITYILVTGFVKGKSGSFTPEVLSQVMSACVVTEFLELLLMRLGLYFLQAPAVLLDILAFTSYKYVGLCVNMVLGILFGPRGYYGAFLWTATAMAYFMFKSMAHSIPPGNSSREMFILGFAALQYVVVWWLGYTGDLN